jgi:hypothetical protein
VFDSQTWPSYVDLHLLYLSLIHVGTDVITGNSALEMEWKRYDTKIVNEYQVMLVGWLVSMFDPHVLSIKDLETCYDALKGPQPTCYWCKISNEELQQRHEELAAKKASGDIVTKLQKKRSDAGNKRGGRGNKKRSLEDDSDKENDVYTRWSKTIRSASIIPSDDEN